jgi:hypothetical protein
MSTKSLTRCSHSKSLTEVAFLIAMTQSILIAMPQLPQPDAFEEEVGRVLDLVSESAKSPASTVLDAESPSVSPTLPDTLTQLPDVQIPVSLPTRDGESPTMVASPEQPLKRIKLVDVWCETPSVL